MVEPISATLAAIALVKSGFEHASDLKDIAGSDGGAGGSGVVIIRYRYK
jgi:hypothetical protein